MKIAIVGGGVSGLVAGYHLHKHHEIKLFEANNYIGGHTNTIDVELEGQNYAVDTGFIVFNDRTYPNFIQLMDELGVESQPTRMSFSVSCEKTGLEYRGADLGGLFAQRKNFFSPWYLRLLWDLLKFNRLGEKILSSDQPNQTVEEFFETNHFSSQFLEQYFYPMGAAIWSSSFKTFKTFPIKFIAEFYKNHGLLGVTDRPQWRVIRGGSKQYIGPLIQDWRQHIQVGNRVESIRRGSGFLAIKSSFGDYEVFDHVIFACHADQALKLLDDLATPTETEILSAFPYQENTAILHTQDSVLPKTKRAWACWNYYNPVNETDSATVTYNMNILQSIDAPKTFCVTLNDTGRIKAENIIKTISYSHPTFGINRKQMQDRHHELIGKNQTSFCGAYWGNGFHEDGVKSAFAVVDGIKNSTAEVSSDS